jgi:lipopolysaccharide transport system permease protein
MAENISGLKANEIGSATRIVIQPSRGWSSLGLKDVWEYRELLYFMILREIQGRYRQTALGFSWMFLRPLLNMAVLTLTFGLIVKVPSEGLPYPLFSLSAVLPWSFFSQAVGRASYSLVENRGVISKVYFPRLIAPLAGVFSGLVDFGASFIVFMLVLPFYHMPLRIQMLWIPLLLLVALLFALAVGLWLATLAARYHDVAFAINFIIQLLMYMSPVIYPVSIIPEQLQFVYQLNPMTGVIQGFRWALLGAGNPPDILFLGGVVIILVGLVSGAFVFRRTERTIVDII